MSNLKVTNFVGFLGGCGAVLSDLASMPRNALAAIGKSASVAYKALAWTGGAAAMVAGSSMAINGTIQTFCGEKTWTKVDGLMTALGGVAFVIVGFALIQLARGNASWILAFPFAGIPMGGLLAARTFMRISETKDFREKLNLVSPNSIEFWNLLNNYGDESLSRILGSICKDDVDKFLASAGNAKTATEIYELVKKATDESLATQYLLVALLVVWVASMSLCLVNPNSVAIDYLFGGSSAFWLLVDSKGVPGFELLNKAFLALSTSRLARANAEQSNVPYDLLTETP